MDIYVIILITILVGMVNALKDTSALGRFKRDWWNKGRSWKRKWKLAPSEQVAIKNTQRLWYYFGVYKPNYVEKFPYSSTILVSLTDGWHLLQQIQFSLIFLGKAILLFDDPLNILISFIVMKTLFSLSFEIVYKKFERTRK